MEQASWQSQPIWLNMDPKKKMIMEQLLEQSKGKRLNESAGVIMAAITQMRNQKLSFTSEETELMMEELTKDMSQKERSKVDMMKQLIKSM